ncbi:MAG: V-type ATP synthase subunit A [Intrasporangiaceae bacterium]|nr:V-type ATP synthase subunit A [Intrasporangiaceae bacterium]
MGDTVTTREVSEVGEPPAGAAGELGSDGRRRTGRVVRVSGPLVEVEGLAELAMLELVAVGPQRVSAETVAIQGTRATLQAYEYTGGIRVGDGAKATGDQLVGILGPGLLGHAFDGLLRPLTTAPLWLGPDRGIGGRDGQEWRFAPTVEVGAHVAPGEMLGIVPESGSVEHRVLVPAGVAGEVTWLAPDAPLGALDVVARIGPPGSVAGVAGAGASGVEGGAAGDGATDAVEVRLSERWPVRSQRPFRDRPPGVVPLHTGQRVLDLLYPLARGAAAAVPGGFGTGKTMLLQQVAKWSDADVIVYVGCGERGNEMADVLDGLAQLVDARTGGRLIDRTVIIANASNMPMMAREASIYTGICVAEYYRDMGHDTVVIADSTSRWAEALREFANRNGDLPAEEGYPASLASDLAAFYERAGQVTTLGGRTASVTVIGAVSPPGGDMTEPVTTVTQRFVRSLWLLDRELAYSRHYPAVSWTGSFARDTDSLGLWHSANGDPGWAGRRARAAALLAEADRLADLAEIIGASSLPGHERMVLLGGRLLRDGVLLQNALSPNDGFCSAAKGAALLDLVLDVVDTCQNLVERGTPATVIERHDFGPVLRVREDVGPDDAAGVAARRATVLRDLQELR